MRQVVYTIPTGYGWIIAGLILALVFGAGYRLLLQKAPQRTSTLAVLKTLVGLSVLAGVAGWLLARFVPEGIPVYGYGLMLFVAFLACTALASHRGEQEGIPREYIQDVAIWLFVGGLLVSRFTYLIQDDRLPFPSWEFAARFPRIWDGGVILYGAVIGGLLGYGLAYVFVVRKHHLSGWKIADIAAPSIALGIGLGRIGCLLNGCCYGHVACLHCPSGAVPVSVCPHGLGVSFPLSAPPRFELVARGYQSAAGFVMVSAADDPRTVASVEPGSPAGRVGLQPGDVLVMINGRQVSSPDDVRASLSGPPEERREVKLTVERAGRPVELDAFRGGSPADFRLIDGRVVRAVEPDSAAARAGLQAWDRIIRVDDRDVEQYHDLAGYLASPHVWPRGKADLKLTVVKGDSGEQTFEFVPWTIGLHPTQVYESISMLLLFAVLMCFYPLRRRDGEVMAILMVGYAVHRTLNEMLRNDVRPEGFEKYASLLLFAAGVALFVWLRFMQHTSPQRKQG